MNIYKPEPAEVLEVRDEAKNVKTIRLLMSREFSFAPGQFNMVSVLGVGEAPFSISSDPGEKFIEHTIRIVGRVTTALSRLRKGDVVWIRGPFGRGWPLDLAEGRDLLLIAGGMGLAPIRPVLEHVGRFRARYGAVELLYGARSPSDLLYRDLYEKWRSMENFELRLTVDSVNGDAEWKHRVGLVTVLLKEIEVEPRNSLVFVCGPEVMMGAVVKELLQMGFAEEQIYLSMERRMECGVGKCGHCMIGGKYVCKEGPIFCYSELAPLPDKAI